MAKTANTRYKVKSNIKEYIERAFLKKKYDMLIEKGIKYYRLSFFEEIAKYCGIEASTVSQMHVRNLNPSYLVAIKMSEFLDAPVTEIWEIVEIENSNTLEKLGQVTMDLKKLYNKYKGKLKFVRITNEENIYFDMYNSHDTIMCMHGEQCNVISFENDIYTLVNNEGDTTFKFKLTKEEFDFMNC